MKTSNSDGMGPMSNSEPSSLTLDDEMIELANTDESDEQIDRQARAM